MTRHIAISLQLGMAKVALVANLCALAVLAPMPVNAQSTQATPEITTEPLATPAIPQLAPMAEAIKTRLASAIANARTKALKARITKIDEYYANTDFAPIWITDNRISKKGIAAIEALLGAANDGLTIADYGNTSLAEMSGATQMNDLATLEVSISTSILSYAQHMSAGRLDPSKVNREIAIYPKKTSAEVVLHHLRGTSNLKIFLRLLAPHTPRYERLREALSNYRRIEKAGGWTLIPKGEVLKAGMEDERVPILRARLIEANTLEASSLTNPETPNLFGETLVDAVKTFQERHGLAIDGAIGPQTLAQFNVSVTDRIRTMELNMERNRWLQNDFGDYHVFANLADQVVKLVKNGKTVHAEVIQVGQTYHRTPVFSDEMERVELNPYWNVPVSIAVNEYLPKLKSNPSYLNSIGLQVLRSGKVVSPHSIPWSSYRRGRFPVRLRQPPGPKNALGRVKFMFPNKYSVYMHDTPSKHRFNSASRFFSHGCLRLKDPLKMAEFILGAQGYDRKRIDRIIAGRKHTVVKLKEKIPVHVVYLTAWVNKDGSVNFRKDVYGRDKILAKALTKVRGI
ncbi:MAG: L,D-transpeptidase family protein [Rhizobiaceae bacterium]